MIMSGLADGPIMTTSLFDDSLYFVHKFWTLSYIVEYTILNIYYFYVNF